VDDIAIGEFSASPYRALWQVTPGIHTARALGIAADGQTIHSAPVQFVVREEKDF